MTVVKVSIPLAVTGNVGGAAALPLIYDRQRLHQVMQDVPVEVLAALNGEPKGYFNATWDREDHFWVIGSRVADDPSW